MLFLLMVDIARADLQNAKKLARKNTIVIMDDTMYTPEWVLLKYG